MVNRCRPLYCVCWCVIPQRVVTAFLCALGLFIFYAQRACVAFLIHELGTYEWADTSHDAILGLYHLGYLLGLWIGSLADRYGGSWICCICICISTILFVSLPLLYEYTPWYLVCFDILTLSLCQGCFFPGIAVLTARWVPPNERATLGAFVFAPFHLASTLGKLSFKFTDDSYSAFNLVFYCWGLISTFWCILFFCLVYDGPDVHPRLTEEERDYLSKTIPANVYMGFKADVIKDPGLSALFLGQIGHTAIVYLLTESMCLHFEKKKWAPVDITIIMLPSLLIMWITAVIFGAFFDKQIYKQGWSLFETRRRAVCISFTVSCIFLLCASYSTHKIPLTMCYGLAAIFKSIHYASFRVNHMDRTVNYIGIVVAMIESIGYISYYLIRSLNTLITIEDWDIMAWFATVINMLYMTGYYFMCKVDRAAWDQPASNVPGNGVASTSSG